MSNEEDTKKMTFELVHRSLAQIIAETGILVLIALAALVGNSCVLYVFYKSPNLRQITNYYLITLAVSNGVLGLVVVPIAIAIAANGRDVIGNRAGQAIGFIFTELVLCSLYTISLISINRFFCVVKPLIYRKHFKPKLTIFMIVGIWIFSLSFVLVVCWSGKGTFDFYPGRFLYLLAFNDLTTEKIFRAVFQLVFVIFPMSLSIICCWKVHKIVKEHNTTVMANFNGVITTENRSKFSRKDIDITKSLLALVCGFIFCWLPCTTIFHLAVYVNLPRYVEVFSIYTAFSSCAVNPIVLNIFNRPFRRQFTEIFFSARMRNEVAVEQGPTTY